MKKIILTAFAALMALAVFTGCEYNAIDEKKLPVEWSSPYTVSNDIVAKAKEGAVLKISIEPKNNASNIQVIVASGYWSVKETQFYAEKEGGNLVKNDGTTKDLYYRVSFSMAAAVKEQGMLLVGSGYIVKNVSIEEKAPANPLESELEEVKKELEEIKKGSSSEKKQPSIKTVSSIKIEKNETYNNQAVITFLDESNEYVAKKGDVLTFTIKGTPDGDVSGLKAFIIDNSKAAGYWNQLSSYINTDINLTKNTETTITVTATITADASSKEPAACKLALYFEPVQDDPVTIAVSSFDVKVE